MVSQRRVEVKTETTNRSVVILLSDKRSGSTLVQRELCRHSAVQTVAYSPHTYLETHHWLKGAVLLDMAPESFAGGRTYRGYGSRENARTYLIDCVTKNVPTFHLPQNDRELIFAGWEALCDKFAQPVFFEKSPQLLAHWAGLSLLLEWINSTSFNVKLIGLVRNPLSVIHSASQLFHTDPAVRQFGWLETYKNLLAFRRLLPDDACHLMRYEDIVAQPEQTFAAISKFVEVEGRDDMGRAVYTEALAKWKADPHFTLQLDNTVKQMAERFGYSQEELENPDKPAPSLTYRLRKKLEGASKLTLAQLRDRHIKPANLRQHRRSD